MTPVFPYLIRRSKDGWRGELLLRLRNGKSAYVVHLSLEQARMLAVELCGLATDHCPRHHLAARVTESLNAKINYVVIQRMGPSDEVIGMMRLVTASGLRNAYVDAAAALALAIHMGLPIFMDGEFSPAEPHWESHQHDAVDAEAPAPGLTDLTGAGSTPIPQVFQEFIEELKMPDGNETSDSWPDDFRLGGNDRLTDKGEWGYFDDNRDHATNERIPRHLWTPERPEVLRCASGPYGHRTDAGRRCLGAQPSLDRAVALLRAGARQPGAGGGGGVGSLIST